MTEVKITNVPGYCRVQIKGHAGYGFNHHYQQEMILYALRYPCWGRQLRRESYKCQRRKS